jgi:hypothetical protein
MTLADLRVFCAAARAGHKPGERLRLTVDAEDLERLVTIAELASLAGCTCGLREDDPRLSGHSLHCAAMAFAVGAVG